MNKATITVEIKSGKGLVKNTSPLQMDVETQVTDKLWAAKYFFFGDMEYKTFVRKFYDRLVKEIETQHEKKLYYMEGSGLPGTERSAEPVTSPQI